MRPHLPAQDASLRRQPLSARLRLAYSVGIAPEVMVNTALNVFLLYYLTSICGMSPSLAGFAVAGGLIVDALLDPWIGMRSDHLRSRWGRRLPFMLFALPLMMVSFTVLFSLPRIENQAVLFPIVLLLCLATRISLSVFGLPFLAVGAEISDEDAERARIIAWRSGTGMILATATLLLGFGVFFEGQGGIAQREAYSHFALTIAALVALLAALASWAVHRTLARQHPAPAHEPGTLRELFRELRQLFHSPTFRTIFLACLLCATYQCTTQALGLHVYTYFWKLGGDQTQFAMVAYTVGLILGAPIGGLLMQRCEHRTTIVMGIFGLMLVQALPPTLKLCGLLTAEGSTLVAVLTAAQLLAGTTSTVAILALLSMATEAIDEHEYQHGVRIEALYFAGWILAGKAANGLGAFLAGAALQWIAFPAQAVGAGEVIAIPERTTQFLGLIFGPGAAVFGAATLIVLMRYPLDRRTHRTIMSALRQRKGLELQNHLATAPLLQPRMIEG